jgi:hypothetical protein
MNHQRIALTFLLRLFQKRGEIAAMHLPGNLDVSETEEGGNQIWTGDW